MPGAYTYGWDYDNNCWRKIRVNDQGKLIVDPSELFEEPPTDGETGKGATSNWCHDHKIDAAAHHVKYTDAEARGSINNIFGSDGRVDKNIFFDNKSVLGINALGFLDIPIIGHIVQISYEVGTATLKMWGKDVEGNFVDLKLEKYDGAVYRLLATEPVVDTKISDHAAIAAAHHAKYTDAEAVDSFGNRVAVLTTGEYTDYNVANISLIYLNTTGGDVDLKGLAGGSDGHMIFFIKVAGANTVNLYNSSGDAAVGDRIICQSGANETIPALKYGGFRLIYQGTYWFADHNISL